MEWISIKDRLPEQDGFYLVYGKPYSSFAPDVFVQEYVQGIGFTYDGGLRENSITHWMLLPVLKQHTVDVQEARHGQWETRISGLAVSNKHYYCSVCGGMSPANIESKYCPNCGAKMKRSRRK